MAKLKSVFKEGGVVTAANSSKISDGASALVLMSKEKALALGVKPMAKVGAQAAAGVELEDVLVAPIQSIPKCLKKAGLSLKEIDLFEINEAFSATTVAIFKTLGIDEREGQCPRRRGGHRSSHWSQRCESPHHPTLCHERQRSQKGNGLSLSRWCRGRQFNRGTSMNDQWSMHNLQ